MVTALRRGFPIYTQHLKCPDSAETRDVHTEELVVFMFAGVTLTDTINSYI